MRREVEQKNASRAVRRQLRNQPRNNGLKIAELNSSRENRHVIRYLGELL